jgi:hypothetical protein
MNQLSLLPGTPTKPWPEEIVERLNGQMTAIEHIQGRLYCVRDWVYVVSSSTSRNRNNPFNDLKRALRKRGEWNRIYDSFIEAPNPAANHRTMAFASDVGLYEVTIRLDDRTEAVRRVKTQMARSLAFQDWACCHPDQVSPFFAQLHASDQAAVPTKPPDYYRLRHADFTPLEAKQVLRERARLKLLFKEATSTWQAHGAVGADFPRLVNTWSQVVKGNTATQIKRELGLAESLGTTTVRSIWCSIRSWRLSRAVCMTSANLKVSTNWRGILPIHSQRCSVCERAWRPSSRPDPAHCRSSNRISCSCLPLVQAPRTKRRTGCGQSFQEEGMWPMARKRHFQLHNYRYVWLNSQPKSQHLIVGKGSRGR